MLHRILRLVLWIGTVLILAALAIRIAERFTDLGPEWDTYVTWAARAGFVCLAIYVAGQWREVGRWFQGPQARLSTMAVLSLVAALGIVGLINWVAVRRNATWDLTENQIYSLSDQTVRILDRLENPVRIMIFAEDTEFQTYRDQMERYANASDLVSIEYIDPDRKPALAAQYEVQAFGTVVFEYEGRVERVASVDEQELTNALIKVLSGEERTVYFTGGHGEHDPMDSDARGGYSGISAALGRDNFGVKTLVLAQEGAVPEDATVVIVAGPTIDFFAPEVEVLRRYIDGGGKVLFMVDPPESANAAPLANLAALIQDWGVDLGNDVVLDISGMGQLLGTDATVPVAATYPPHAITDGFAYVTAYPMARSVTPSPAPTAGLDAPVVQSIVQTSARSWAESDIAGIYDTGEVSMDAESGDRQGPISLGVAITADVKEPAPETPGAESADGEANGDAAEDTAADGDAETRAPQIRLAVFGDSDFVANNTGAISGNADLFLNTVNWLARQENLIAIRPRQASDRRITLTAAQQRNVFWLSLLIIPGLVLGAGVYTWWLRR